MKAAEAHLSLRMSKCHIFGNHVSRLKYLFLEGEESLLCMCTACPGVLVSSSAISLQLLCSPADSLAESIMWVGP